MEVKKVPEMLSLKNDIVFQKLFGSPKNSKITGHLLSLILGREIYNVDLDANKMMIGNNINAKTGRLDIRVKFNDGEDCNIELQVKPFKYMENRMLEYWAMMYSNKIHRGQNYEVLKPSISILIADYNVEQAKGIEDYHSKWNLREEKHKDLKLTNDIELHILEIPKVKEENLKNDELAQWLKFISNPEDKEVQEMMSENEYYKQARKELESFSGDENFMRLVESRAGFLMDQETEKLASKEAGIAIGKEEGIAKGEKNKQKEIAKKMKAKKIPLDEIIELTGLPKEEIEKI